MPKDNLTFEYVNDVLSYDAQTGEFTWKERSLHHFKNEREQKSFNRQYAHKVAGTLAYSYHNKQKKPRAIAIGLKGKMYVVHRLAWLLHYGTWPILELDHINGDPFDNRIDNLREATHSQNLANRGKTRNNKSGQKGVYWRARCNKWQAVVANKYIGLYSTKEEAAAAYNEAAKNLFGVFAKE